MKPLSVLFFLSINLPFLGDLLPPKAYLKAVYISLYVSPANIGAWDTLNRKYFCLRIGAVQIHFNKVDDK